MATLTGKTIASTYKDLLQVSNSNSGIDGTKRAVSDGEATASPLELSSSAVNISSGFELGGSEVTASATELNVMDGSTTTQATVTLAGTDGVVISDGDTMKQALVSDFEVYMEANLDTMGSQFTSASSLATVGDLNSGSITSGFGAINNGESTITTTGTVSTGALTVGGNIDFNSGTIDLSTQTVDVTLNGAVDALNFDSNTLSIDASNNRVGIGTDSPDKLLDIDGVAVIGNAPSTSADVPLELKGMGVSDGANPYGNYGGILFSADGNYTGSAHKFLITNALNANKFAIIRSSNATTDPTLGTAGAITSGTADFVIDTDGNVGIGTASPRESLNVVGGNILVDSTSSQIGYWNPSDTTHSGYLLPYDASGFLNLVSTFGTGGILFKTGTSATERLRIASSGYVGIGTDSPDSKLEVSDGVVTITENSNGGISAITMRQTRGSVASPSNSNANGDGSYLIFQTYNSGYQSIAQIAGLSGSATDSGDLIFNTKPTGGAIAEAMRIDSAGDVTVSTGNLVIGTHGKGIDFSANTDDYGTPASGAEILDDYEEGTITFTTNSDATGSFFDQGGNYTKIGNLVHVTGVVYIDAGFTDTSIAGLPFNYDKGSSVSSWGMIGNVITTSQTNIVCALFHGTDEIRFTGGGQASSLHSPVSGQYYRFSFSYRV